MTHQTTIHADLRHHKTAHRPSPRFGYALAVGGSAVVWSLVAAVVMALT